MDIYAQIQALVQKEARDQALKVYKEQGNRYGVAKVPLHYHNNIDSPNIPSSSIIPGLRTTGDVTFATASQTYYIYTPFKAHSVFFNGVVTKRDSSFIRFTITSGTAYAGAVYTNNGKSFTVVKNAINSTVLLCTNGGTTSGTTLTKSSGTGDATITFVISSSPLSPDPNPIVIRSHSIGNAELGSTYYLQPGTSSSVVATPPLQPYVQSNSYFLIDSTGAGIDGAAAGDQHVISVTYNGTIVARATVTGFSNTYVKIYTDVLLSGWQIDGNWTIT